MTRLVDWRRVEARMHRQALQSIGEVYSGAANAAVDARIALLRSSVRPLAVRPLLPLALTRSGERFAHDTHAANPARRPLFLNRPRHD